MRLVARVLVLTAVCCGALPRVAAADASVMVLGLRSIEGDDDFANAMTDALRVAARKVTGWNALDRSVSMAQMSLAHGCDDVDATCLSDIATGLQADRMLFGTVRRTAARGKYDFELSVSIFNASLRTIGGTETLVVPRAESKVKKALAARADPLVAKLAETDAAAGVLSVWVNVLSAEVRLDGQVAGQTHDHTLLLEGVKEGDHKLEVNALGHLAQSQQVRVSSSQRTEIKINLEPVPEPEFEPIAGPILATDEDLASGSGSSRWLGYTLIGVGAASLVGWGVSMYVVGSTNRNDTFVTYKKAFPKASSDVCELANSNDTASGRVSQRDLSKVKDLCSTGRAFNLLQWVFLGAGVVSASIGTAILVTESGEPETQAKLHEPALTFQPQFDRRSVALQGTLRF